MSKLSTDPLYCHEGVLLSIKPRVAIMDQQRLAVAGIKHRGVIPTQPTLQPGRVDSYLDGLAQAVIATLVESYRGQLSTIAKPTKKELPMRQHGSSIIHQTINNTRTYTMPTTELIPQNSQKFAVVKQSLKIIGTECQHILSVLLEPAPAAKRPVSQPMSPTEYLVRYTY